tara:strand:- start:1245 stop:1421 length:177 start_codon:yes stop_codon:yes gene_type:complete
MPCAACGNKGGMNVGSSKPSTLILGQSRQQTVRRTFVQRPRGLILNVSSRKRFILGRR